MKKNLRSVGGFSSCSQVLSVAALYVTVLGAPAVAHADYLEVINDGDVETYSDPACAQSRTAEFSLAELEGPSDYERHEVFRSFGARQVNGKKFFYDQTVDPARKTLGPFGAGDRFNLVIYSNKTLASRPGSNDAMPPSSVQTISTSPLQVRVWYREFPHPLDWRTVRQFRYTISLTNTPFLTYDNNSSVTIDGVTYTLLIRTYEQIPFSSYTDSVLAPHIPGSESICLYMTNVRYVR